MLSENRQDKSRLYIASSSAAMVASLFAATVMVSMVLDTAHIKRLDPVNAPEIAAMRKDLQAQPSDEKLKASLRQADQVLRQQAAAVQARMEMGRYLLLAGLGVTILAAALSLAARKSPPRPPKVGGGAAPAPKPLPAVVPVSPAGTKSLWAMAGIVVVAGAAGLTMLRLGQPPTWEDKPQPVAGASALDLPSDEEVARNWPMFRGPGGLGVSTAKSVPTKWDGKTGEGILWTMPVPLPGRSSPIVWGKQVFLTGATNESRILFCFDAETGKILWQRDVNSKVAPPKDWREPSDMTGLAAPTPATDGRRVYALFGNGDIGAFDLSGKPLWVKNLGYPESEYGLSASLVATGGRVIVQYDQGAAEEKKSAMIALDGATGAQAWRVLRPVDNSWPSPILIKVGAQAQVVTSANPLTIAYDPADGSELWRAESALGKDLATSPAFAGGMVLVASKADSSIIKGTVAISTGGAGGPPGHVAWTDDKMAADVPSPLGMDGAFLIVHSNGDAALCEAATGKRLWEQTLPKEAGYYSSPILADGRVYLFDRKGVCTILKASRTPEVVGRCEFDEECETTPAFMDGRIFLRCGKNLYCIGDPK